MQQMMGHDSSAMAVARAMSEHKEVDIQKRTEEASLNKLDFTLQCDWQLWKTRWVASEVAKKDGG